MNIFKKILPSILVCILFFFRSSPLHADYWTPDPKQSIERAQDQMPETNEFVDTLSFVPAPYLGYSDTYGFLSGVAGVLYDAYTQTRLTTSVITDFNAYFRYRIRFDWIEPENFILTATGAVGNDYQDYYGEGDSTPNVYQAMTDQYDQFTLSYQRCIDIDTGLYAGPLIQYVNRTWLGSTILFPNESEWRVGLQATRDTRDNNLESHEGSYFQAGVYTEPQSGSTGWRADVIQLEGDARHFVDLGNDRVLALRANTGLTLGDPSYSFVYSLGGLNELRGYHSNRFRGKEFYGLQAELRFPIFPWLNGSTSLDGGDITDTQFNGTFLLTYQVGLRTDLLLKEGVVFRVDFGIGADQNEVQFNISEPF